MAQVQTQIQQIRQEQQLRLSLQQLQMVKLLEMPIAEFEESVKREIMDNPALEDSRYADNVDRNDEADETEQSVNDTGDDPYSQELDEKASETIEKYSDDDLPVYTANNSVEERNELPIGDSGSFIEDLEAQMMNYDLDETQQEVLRYLIGLLDSRGYISAEPTTIVDELAFKCYIYVDEAYVEEMLTVLKSFDPAGIGAKDAQECLLLQIDRELQEDVPISELKERFILLERKVIADHYDLFIKRNEDKLQEVLGVNEAVVKALFASLKKLNIHPGMSLGEAQSARAQSMIPDFIVDTDSEGNVTMHLNSGDVPRIHVRREYIERLKAYQAHPEKMSRSEKEGLMYTQKKVDDAQMFIESIKQRRRTMYETMNAIIKLQRKFFISRDEDDKVRMVLKDVAAEAGYDISTVSRVCNAKCCLLDGHIYPLTAFFKLTRKNADGKEVDSHRVEEKLRTLIEGEDKFNPLSDDQIAALLTADGIKLARRTVAKYRKQYGIPSIAERKK